MASGDPESGRPSETTYRRPRRPTMRDVAELANVSVQTVSNVANDRAGEVAPETRVRVLAAMARLAYVPNSAARGLRSTRQNALAFLVLDEGAQFLADPMTALVLAGLGDVARERGYGVLIRASRPGHVDEGLLAPLLEHRVDGACVLLSGEPATRRSYAERMTHLGYPFVLFETTEDSTTGSVTADNVHAGRILTEHLLSQGHDRIAFATTRTSWPMVEERLVGYREALSQAGIRPRREYLITHGTWDPRSGSEAAIRLLNLAEPPTAIIGGNDLFALGIMQEARNRGLTIPADVAVAGFNDFAFAAFVDPPLTTVRIPGYELGRTAAQMLIDQLERGATSYKVVLPVDLRPRASA